MLTYAKIILSHFTSAATIARGFDYFELIPLDVEETLYLCCLNKQWFLLFETDFVMNLQRTYADAERILGNEFTFVGWVAVDAPDEVVPNDMVGDDEKMVTKVIYKHGETHMRYGVVQLHPKQDGMIVRVNAYGGAVRSDKANKNRS